MKNAPPDEPRELSFEQLADAHDLRSVISAALAVSPIDERSLRRGVWTYVVAARDVGTSPGQVIDALTLLVSASGVTTVPVRVAVTRRVILWCVEAYFGRLGGEVEKADEDDELDRPAPPMIVSNR